MLIKFKATTMSEYKGINGLGEHMSLKAGDVCEVSADIAKLLMQYYSRDFEISVEEKPLHSPKLDKQLKKTAKFKSK